MRKRGVSMVVSVALDQVAGEGELDLSQALAVDPARTRALEQAHPQAPLAKQPSDRRVAVTEVIPKVEAASKEFEA